MNKENLNNLKISLKYAKKQKKIFIKYIIASIFLGICGTIAPLLYAKELLIIKENSLNQLFIIALFVLGIEVLRNISRYFTYMFSQIFFREILKELQIDLAGEMLKIKTHDLDKNSTGTFISRLSNDTEKMADIFLELNETITEIVMDIGILLAIFIISKIYFIFFVIACTIIFIIEKARTSKFNELDKMYRKHNEKTTTLATELVRGIRDIKVLNAEKSFMHNLKRNITDLNTEKYKMRKQTNKYNLLISNTWDIIDFIFICLSIIMLNHSLISVANVVIVYMYRDRIFYMLNVVGRMLEKLKDFALSSSRVIEIIDSENFEKESFGSKHIKKIKGDFKFSNVHFSYSNDKEILKGINFEVKHNQTVSFVGKSGAGKSTIFSLLAKLYEPTSGNIFIDGINQKELDKTSIRGNISIITQNPYIFNMSIRENLTIVKNDLTEADMIKACKMACLHDYIMDLPNGYDTLVGEGGINLSGGQRQRLAVARALVQKTEIILFDEATSSLDNETQASIQEAINNMKSEYTILIIAHRLSTVINSDKIFLIDEGKVIDEGTHEYLLKNNKEYKKLYNLELKDR